MIGERIQSIRRYYGETQQQLADSIHLSVHSIRAWEQNKSSITIDSVKAICAHYKISADYLLEMTDDDPDIARARRDALTAENRSMIKRLEEFLIHEQKSAGKTIRRGT